MLTKCMKISSLLYFSGGQKCQEARKSRSAKKSDAGSDGGLFAFRKTVKYPPYHKYSDFWHKSDIIANI